MKKQRGGRRRRRRRKHQKGSGISKHLKGVPNKLKNRLNTLGNKLKSSVKHIGKKGLRRLTGQKGGGAVSSKQKGGIFPLLALIPAAVAAAKASAVGAAAIAAGKAAASGAIAAGVGVVQIYTDKNKEQWMKCNHKNDFKTLNDEIKKAKTKEEKDAIRSTYSFGCGMNMRVKDYMQMEKSLYALKPKEFPKCQGHNLYCKVAIATKGPNQGKTFFACDAQPPNVACASFQWVTNELSKLRYLPSSVDFSKITCEDDISSKISNPYFEVAVKAAKKAAEEKALQEVPRQYSTEIPTLPPPAKKRKKIYEDDIYNGQRDLVIDNL
ncbi:hypothetical protein AC249_AIPGENE24502 [Exaiptasia diaphana]|nr:hypothetical protein AC249_AIPGENE24502 [Exaiptasia diaphana]